MKKILLVLFFPLFALAQISPEFLQLKPVYTNYVRFDYTGAIQTWTVPAGVTQIYVDVVGAQGGSSSPYLGGKGGKVSGLLSVTPGGVLQITVGGQSMDNIAVYGFGGNGGRSTIYGTIARAGGGLSAISTAAPVTQANALLIAGGGGGTATNSYAGNGGAGGGLNGISATSNYGGVNTRGGGASQIAGGVAGSTSDVNSTNPTAGAAINGGAGGIVGGASAGWNGGGGGGAGYFGGGGGAGGGNAQGAGGGGSSWTHASVSQVSNVSNFNTGHGRVIIYYK
ncbi:MULTISPECIES: glycine-rich protein [Flavobacterium]|uniref:glycine-rich protein n=1 Tax=Flavobacterium TaxID=237 RepID=UPI0022252881|nr:MULTISPECIES: glycine-rich protein [Flavobacterium]